jgi:protein N-terminal methyltransferase
MSKLKVDEAKFYQASKDYWSTQPATVNGMLGGFDFISDIDILQSQTFLNSFVNVI